MKRIYYRNDRRKTALMVSYFAAALVVMGCFLVSEHRRAESSQRALATGVENASAVFTAEAEKLSRALIECSYAQTREMAALLCSEIYSAANSASAALNSLGLTEPDESFKKTAAEIIKASGGCSRSFTRKTVSGEDLSDADREDLSKLAQSSGELVRAIENLQKGEPVKLPQPPQLTDGTVGDMPETQSPSETTPSETTPSESEHGNDSDIPHLLRGRGEITSAQAAGAAAAYLGLVNNSLKYDAAAQREKGLDVYVFRTNRSGAPLEIEVTKLGGYIAGVNSTWKPQTAGVTPDEASDIARRFLAGSGYPDMREVLRTTGQNTCEFVFAYSGGGVVYYPDTIDVTVALDTGGLLGLDSTEFLMNRRERGYEKPRQKPEKLMEKISGALTVLSHNLAVIKSHEGGELLCYELKCEDLSGRNVELFFNAETGAEEKVSVKNYEL